MESSNVIEGFEPLRFIGDVHGKFSAYESLTQTCTRSIQVGDFGVGFGIDPPILSANHMFIRGNHDNPEECNAHICCLGDFGYMEDDHLFWLAGAVSIDKQFRLPGRDCWPGEECSEPVLHKAIKYYLAKKPAIMVSHMLPHSIQQEFFHFDPPYPCRTSYALDRMWEFHQPKLWICGHYHRDVDRTAFGTRFIVLNELSYFDLTEPIHSEKKP